ncbi:MAG: MATE family efflux transporter [Cyclobacteriaceae bacterium]|nr:MATE family efflux transporter [Cyclobacteriaceae bacterium]
MKLSSYRSEIKTSFLLAYPVMLSQLGHVMMGVSDNVMVGHLGAEELAASGLANVAFNVLMLFGIGVSYAITPLVATADGEKNIFNINETLRHGLVINVVTSLVLVTIVFFAKNLLYHIDQPAEVIALSIPYLEIITFSIIPMLIFQTYRQFSEGLSNTWIPMIIVLACNVLNILLNYILIYGHAGFPALGLNGAGWATFISRIVMGCSLAAFIYYAPRFRQYRPGFAFGKYSRALFSKMLNIGLPAGLQFIFEVAAFDFSLVMMGWMGTSALAAHQIAINLATVSYMTTSGLAAAAAIRVSHELGKGDITALRKAAFVLLGMALSLMTAWGIFFVVGKNFLPQLYVEDLEVIRVAGPLIIIAGLFQLSDGMQVVIIGALRGLQDVKIPSVFIFISYWIIGLPLGYWLGFQAGLGPVGIWTGLLVGLTLTATAMVWRFNYLSLKLKSETRKQIDIAQ